MSEYKAIVSSLTTGRPCPWENLLQLKAPCFLPDHNDIHVLRLSQKMAVPAGTNPDFVRACLMNYAGRVSFLPVKSVIDRLPYFLCQRGEVLTKSLVESTRMPKYSMFRYGFTFSCILSAHSFEEFLASSTPHP